MDRETLQEVFTMKLLDIKRFGVDALAKWITEKSDLFTAPAATKGPLAFEGALIQRVLCTQLQLEQLYSAMNGEETPLPDSYNLAALLTGLSRVNTMVADTRPGNEGKYVMRRDKFELPIGRCERGLYLAGRYIRLLPEEIVALRWFDLESCKVEEYNTLAASCGDNEELKAVLKKATPDTIILQQYAAQKFQLVQMLQTAWVLAADSVKPR